MAAIADTTAEPTAAHSRMSLPFSPFTRDGLVWRRATAIASDIKASFSVLLTSGD